MKIEDKIYQDVRQYLRLEDLKEAIYFTEWELKRIQDALEESEIGAVSRMLEMEDFDYIMGFLENYADDIRLTSKDDFKERDMFNNLVVKLQEIIKIMEDYDIDYIDASNYF